MCDWNNNGRFDMEDAFSTWYFDYICVRRVYYEPQL